MSDESTFLFARPSFVAGMASIVDFQDTLTEFNRMPTGEIADRVALESDWRAVGADLKRAIERYIRSRTHGEAKGKASEE